MLQNLGVLIGRLLLALIFLVEGVLKLGNTAGVADYMAGHGVSPALLPLVIATEIGGGLLVAIGWLTRWAALGLAAFCLLAAAYFHRDMGDADQVIHAGKNLAMAGGFLLLAAFGAGSLSLDGRGR